MKKFLKKFIDILEFCLGIRGTDTGKRAADENLIDYSGQGRDQKYWGGWKNDYWNITKKSARAKKYW